MTQTFKRFLANNVHTVLEVLPNGGEVIKRRDLNAGGFATQPAEIVLCYLPHNDVTPFATWQRNVPERGGDGETYWGHYYDSIFEAERDFEERGSK